MIDKKTISQIQNKCVDIATYSDIILELQTRLTKKIRNKQTTARLTSVLKQLKEIIETTLLELEKQKA